MRTNNRLYSAALAGSALLSLLVAPSHGQTYYATDATINHGVGGTNIVGEDGLGHNSNPTVTLASGGFINGTLDTYNASTFDMNAGVVLQGVTSHDSSVVNLTGGLIENGAQANDNSTMTITGGSVTSALGSAGHAHLTVYGGNIEGLLLASSTNPLTITGGTFSQGLNAYETAVVAIQGGSLVGSGGAFASDSSQYVFYGHGLSSALSNPDDGGFTTYTLTGSLLDGSSISGMIVGLQNGSAAQFQLINVTPEPGAFALLLGLGSATCGSSLRRRRREATMRPDC